MCMYIESNSSLLVVREQVVDLLKDTVGKINIGMRMFAA